MSNFEFIKELYTELEKNISAIISPQFNIQKVTKNDASTGQFIFTLSLIDNSTINTADENIIVVSTGVQNSSHHWEKRNNANDRNLLFLSSDISLEKFEENVEIRCMDELSYPKNHVLDSKEMALLEGFLSDAFNTISQFIIDKSVA